MAWIKAKIILTTIMINAYPAKWDSLMLCKHWWHRSSKQNESISKYLSSEIAFMFQWLGKIQQKNVHLRNF